MKRSLILGSICLILSITCSYAQDKKIAVVTFYVVKQISVAGFGTANTAAAVSQMVNEPTFNLAPALKSLHNQFFDTYSKDFPFQLLPEDQVINNEAYKVFVPVGETGTDVLKDNANLPSEGYKVVLPLTGHDNEQALLKIFDQCDGIMKVYIDFNLEKRGFGGMAIVKVNAHANIAIFNKAGKKVFSVKEDAQSKISGALIVGIPFITVDKVLPLCQSAMDELMIALQADMPKLVKKADKKL